MSRRYSDVRPRLVVEIPLECRAELRIDADSHEDEVRLRDWLRRALRRREPFSDALDAWLDELDELEAA